MPMPVFPAYAVLLPDGFEVSRESAIERTQMESGPPKQLRTKSRVMVTRRERCAFFSAADYASFLDWFDVDADAGAAWFSWTDPVDGLVKSARIVSALEKEAPVAGVSSWIVSFSLETWG